MPLDFIDHDIEVLWTAFGNYICKPYHANPVRTAEIKAWFYDLYDRRERDGIKLSYCRIVRETMIPAFVRARKTFDAFCLNDEIYISEDAAILTLPYARYARFNDFLPDRRIGIWLHDFGVPDQSMENLYKEEQAIKTRPPYIENIHQTIATVLAGPSLPGRRANTWLPDHARLSPETRICFEEPLSGSLPHYDRQTLDHFVWNRVIIHSFLRTGTVFLLGEDYTLEVTLMPGATSSHVSTPRETGAFHYARGHILGRGVYIGDTQTTDLFLRPPWSLTPCAHPSL